MAARRKARCGARSRATIAGSESSAGRGSMGPRARPGDLVVGDADGVIAIPPAQVETAVSNAEARVAKEADVKRKLDEGKTLYEVAGLKPLFEAAGIVEIDGIWSDK